MPTFTPPVFREAIPTNDRLLRYFKLNVSASVVKKNGHYVTSRYPWAGDLEGLTEGTDYFMGGRSYTVTSAVASALTADGYGANIT